MSSILVRLCFLPLRRLRRHLPLAGEDIAATLSYRPSPVPLRAMATAVATPRIARPCAAAVARPLRSHEVRVAAALHMRIFVSFVRTPLS